MICLVCFITSCGKADPVSRTSTVDYGDAESFEAALNAGENLEGKTVRIKVKEFHPNSDWGYNLWAGEHLNFVSSRNPDIKAGDEAVLRATVIESVMGSWKISYEKVLNAVDGETTVYSSARTENTPTASAPDTTKKESPKQPSESTSAPDTETENSFTSNQYYDVVEEAVYQSYSNTVMIYKLLAKQNVSVEAQRLAYSPAGSVIGKSSSEITLTKGQANYFRFSFKALQSDASFETTLKEKKTITKGDRNAIEMVDYNVSGENLYITFRQVTDNPDPLAKFKLLYYNGDQIVGDEINYFSIYAKNLDGKGSTDVASIWVYGKTFDRIEYIYEP